MKICSSTTSCCLWQIRLSLAAMMALCGVCFLLWWLHPNQGARQSCCFFWIEARIIEVEKGWQTVDCDPPLIKQRVILQPRFVTPPRKDRAYWLIGICENESQYADVLRYFVTQTWSRGFDLPSVLPKFQGRAIYVVDCLPAHSAGLPDATSNKNHQSSLQLPPNLPKN